MLLLLCAAMLAALPACGGDPETVGSDTDAGITYEEDTVGTEEEIETEAETKSEAEAEIETEAETDSETEAQTESAPAEEQSL